MKKGVKKKAVVPAGPCSKCFTRLLTIALVLFVFQGWFVLFHPFHNYHGAISNVFCASIAFLALLSAIKIRSFIATNFPRERTGNFFLIVSLFFFFLGDLFWLINESLQGMLLPIGGTADALWILAYISMLVSIVYFISTSFRPSKLMLILIILSGFVIGGTILGLDIGKDLEDGTFSLSHAIQDSYILFDLLVIFMIIYLVGPSLFSDRRYIKHWLVLIGGLVTRLIYDLFFAEMSVKGTYYSGHPIDFIYVAFYICVIYSFYVKSKNIGVRK